MFLSTFVVIFLLRRRFPANIDLYLLDYVCLYACPYFVDSIETANIQGGAGV